MAKVSQAGERIRKLRAYRRETQIEFAKTVGAAQSLVSAWEAGIAAPSAGAYLRLGNLAPYPDNVWFWTQAGIDEPAMLSASAKLLQKRQAKPRSSEIIRIPCVRRTPEGFKDLGRLLTLPRECVANPPATACLVVDKNTASSALPAGDLVVLDVSDNGAPDLSPFWDRIVLVDIDVRWDLRAQADSVAVSKMLSQVSPDAHFDSRRLGLALGRLRYKRVRDPRNDNKPFWSRWACWGATLGPFSDSEREFDWNNDKGSICLGEWQDHPTTHSIPIPRSQEEWAAFEVEARKQAARNLRLGSPVSEVLGRVIGWLRPPAAKQGDSKE